MAVDTRKAERRPLGFSSLADLEADLDFLERAHAEGRLRHSGNWTPGQVFQHCAIFMRCALDGFADRPPLLVCLIARLLFKRRAISGAPAIAGFRLPKKASFLLPDDDVSTARGLDDLRGVIGRVNAGERFTVPSPIFGRLTHEQWLRLQLGHCALHLGFLHRDGETDRGPQRAPAAAGGR